MTDGIQRNYSELHVSILGERENVLFRNGNVQTSTIQISPDNIYMRIYKYFTFVRGVG